MKILYVEGDPQRRTAYAALVARECTDVTFQVAADSIEAADLYDRMGTPDLIISGVSYPGILESYNSGVIDCYNYNCDDKGMPKAPFVFFYDPVKDDRPGEIGTVMRMWADGFCVNPAALYFEPDCTIVDVIKRESGQTVPARLSHRSSAALRKFNS